MHGLFVRWKGSRNFGELLHTDVILSGRITSCLQHFISRSDAVCWLTNASKPGRCEKAVCRFASFRVWRCVFRRVAPDVAKKRGDFMVFALLGCYSAYVGSGLPTFWDNLLVTSSRVKQRKKNTARRTTQRHFAHLNVKQHSTVNPWFQFIVHVSVSLSY